MEHIKSYLSSIFPAQNDFTGKYEKIYFYLFLILAFALPISRAVISLILTILPILWFIEGNLKEKFSWIKSNKALLFLLFYLLFSAVSILWTQDFDDAKRPLRLLLYFSSVFVLATTIKKSYIQPIISAFLAGMFISEVIAYGVYFELWHFKYATPQYPSPFMFHIDYSVFLAFTSILLLNRFFSKRYTAKEKLFIFLFFVTVTGNLFISIGRTGQVAFVFGIIVMVLLHFRLSIKSFFIAITLIGGIFGIAYLKSPNFQKQVYQAKLDITRLQEMNFISSWGTRVAFIITSYNILKEHPLIGVGIGDYMSATQQELIDGKYDPNKFPVEFMQHNHPHNQYLLTTLQTGLIGALLLMLFIYHLLKLPIKDPELKEISILFTTIFFVSCIAEPLFMKQFTIALFILYVGIFTAKDINTTQH